MSSVAQLDGSLEGGGLGSPGGGDGENAFGRKALAHNTNFSKKHGKHDGHNKHGRKRIQSQSGDRGGKFHLPHKKRRKDGHIVPPTKFLLGGNICDPLNLGSLQDEEINRAMNAVTPKSSPLPTPKHRKGEIEVIIPPNINDPLNLNSCEDDDEYAAQLAVSGGSPIKRNRPKSKRKRKRPSSLLGLVKDEVVEGAEGAVTSAKVETPVVDTPESEDAVPAVGGSVAAAIPPESAAVEGGETAEPAAPEPTRTQESPSKKMNRRSDEWTKDRRLRKVDSKDKIVSPVIRQPGQKPTHAHSYGRGPIRPFKRSGKKRQKQQAVEIKFNPKSAAFQYGNYNRYYGYRNMTQEPDLRLKCFSDHPEIFRDKDVLDIGCNVGHVSLSVGRDFRARSVVGIDIDRKLIEIARKNVRHYVNCEQSPAPTASGTPSSTPSHATPSYTPSYGPHVLPATSNKQRSAHDRFFPISMPIVYGPVEIPGITDGLRTPRTTTAPLPFPKNISFVQGNYVPESDALLVLEQPQFDVILCLSITKWLHLNWGDAGLKRAFRRMYAQLRPGGCLILEPQGWSSYTRRKKLTETIWKNFNAIEFFPNSFSQYLLSAEVGFSQCRVLDVLQHTAKNFRRPITMFIKGDPSPSYSATSLDSATALRSNVYAQANSTSASPAMGGRTPDPTCTTSQTSEPNATSLDSATAFRSNVYSTSASPAMAGQTPDPICTTSQTSWTENDQHPQVIVTEDRTDHSDLLENSSLGKETTDNSRLSDVKETDDNSRLFEPTENQSNMDCANDCVRSFD